MGYWAWNALPESVQENIESLHEQGLNGMQIAKALKIGKSSVYRHLKKRNLPTHKSYTHLTPFEETIVNLYENDTLSTLKIAKQVRCSKSGVHCVLRRKGVKLRSNLRVEERSATERNQLVLAHQKFIKIITAKCFQDYRFDGEFADFLSIAYETAIRAAAIYRVDSNASFKTYVAVSLKKRLKGYVAECKAIERQRSNFIENRDYVIE